MISELLNRIKRHFEPKTVRMAVHSEVLIFEVQAVCSVSNPQELRYIMANGHIHSDEARKIPANVVFIPAPGQPLPTEGSITTLKVYCVPCHIEARIKTKQ